MPRLKNEDGAQTSSTDAHLLGHPGRSQSINGVNVDVSGASVGKPGGVFNEKAPRGQLMLAGTKQAEFVSSPTGAGCDST